MLLVLRFIGVINAAIWLGAAVFFTFGIAPSVFSEEMKRIFGDYYVGVIAQQLIARLFAVHAICGVIALIHFFGEMFYAGRTFRRFTFGLIAGALGLGILGGVVMQPKLKSLHQVKYSRSTPDAQRAVAQRNFKWLHAASQVGNMLGLILIIIYTWRIANPGEATRFVSAHKFRG